MTVYTVGFKGKLFTRKSDNAYTHAAFNMNRAGNRGWVSFHTSYDLARKAAGASGEVATVTVSDTGRVHSHGVCIVCEDERYIMNRHADGSLTRDPCYRCNR
jgi:hypothetical protein